jgi:hypothetical protein
VLSQGEHDQALRDEQKNDPTRLHIETTDGKVVDLIGPESVLRTVSSMVQKYADLLKEYDRCIPAEVAGEFHNKLHDHAARHFCVQYVYLEDVPAERGMLRFRLKFQQAPHGCYTLDLPPVNSNSLVKEW